MRTIGLIGGMSWESSIEYYRIINETTKSILGGFHSAKSLMYSVDFAEVRSILGPSRSDDYPREPELSLENLFHEDRGLVQGLLHACSATAHMRPCLD